MRLSNVACMPVVIFALTGLAACVAVHGQYEFFEPTELWEAVTSRDLDTVLAMPKVARDLDWQDANGSTALMYASALGEEKMVKSLLSRGASLSSKDRTGRRAIHYASCGAPIELFGPALPSPETLKLLLDHGADPDARDEDGLTPLHWAATRDCALVVAKRLIEVGADVNAKTDSGRTPLDFAREFRNQEVAKVLEEAGGVEGGVADESIPENESVEPPEPPTEPLSSIALPMTLRSWSPSLEQIEARVGPEEAEEVWPLPGFAVRISVAERDEEPKGCAAAREEYRKGWADEGGGPAAHMAGGGSYVRFTSDEPKPRVEILALEGDTAGQLLSSEPEGSATRLCLMGYGIVEEGGLRAETLHVRERTGDQGDFVVRLYVSDPPAGLRRMLLENLGYPESEPDPAADLLMVNAAGMFPVFMNRMNDPQEFEALLDSIAPE